VTTDEREPLEAVRERAEETRHEVERWNPNWEAELVVLAAILLGLLLPDQLTIGSGWIVPAVEGALLLGLIVSTPHRPSSEDPRRRVARILLVAIVSAANAFALFLLAQALLASGKQDARALLLGGGVLWLTAVLLFGVWFWELDRGGPVRRKLGHDRDPDFVFPQMSDDAWTPAKWLPRVSDYLYLSLTNAASFSPPEDTVPISGAAKLGLSVQTLASLVTMTIVLAYAINNLN
jgi:hypothetical protein